MAVLGIYKHVQEGGVPLAGGATRRRGRGPSSSGGAVTQRPTQKKIRGAHWDKNSIFLENAEDGVSLTPVGFFDRDGDFSGETGK